MKVGSYKKVTMTVGMLSDFGYIFHQGISPSANTGFKSSNFSRQKSRCFWICAVMASWTRVFAISAIFFATRQKNMFWSGWGVAQSLLAAWLSETTFRNRQAAQQQPMIRIFKHFNAKMYSIYWNASAKLNVINQGSSVLVNDWRTCASCWVERLKMQFFSMKSILFYKLV